MTPEVALVLVNGPSNSVQSPRARALFGPDAPIVYKDRGRIGSIRAIRSALKAVRSGWIYCIDLGFPTSILAALHRRKNPGVRLAFEIGDPMKPLFANQDIAPAKVALAHAMDRRLPARADKLVFRGSYLAEYFREIAPAKTLPPWRWVPDGFDPELFRPRRDDPEVAALRHAHGLEGRFVVGIVGSIHFNAKLGMFYGWDLAEALATLPADLPITGVVVGDGPGRPVLEATRDRLGLGDRLRVVGRVPHEEVPLWMNVFDVGLSTQTDDPVGWGRTTAKLPEYLGCGLPLICTDVGEAHRFLARSGQTLAYKGLKDDGYPGRLAERLRDWCGRDLGALRRENREIALKTFAYNVVRDDLAGFLAS